MFLYCITNKLDNKAYIRISRRPKARFSDHTRNKSLIGNAIRKYGKENFDMQVLVEGNDQYIADLESPAILAFQTLHPNGYNLSLETQTSFKHHEVSKEKMRKPKTAEACKNMSKAKKGKPSGRKGTFIHSNETKTKIRDALINIPKSSEFRNKLIGRKLSESHRENISKGNTGKKQLIVICPHCSKQGGAQTMPRWHFDRCKSKGDLK